jgi:hypothetical protein
MLPLQYTSKSLSSERLFLFANFARPSGEAVYVFSQWINHEFGDYPQTEMLVELGRMSRAER